jgi:hypothetical protein
MDREISEIAQDNACTVWGDREIVGSGETRARVEAAGKQREEMVMEEWNARTEEAGRSGLAGEVPKIP